MSRYFFALWPDDAVRDEVVTLADEFSEAGGRKVAKQNFHITLVFLGQIDDKTRAALLSYAYGINGSPFLLSLDRTGWFRRSRVIWVAPSDIPPQLPELVTTLNKLVRNCGLTCEERAYRPHMTLVRNATKAPRYRRFKSIHWDIKDFCLVESITHEKGAEYKVLQRWPFMPE